MSTSLTTVTLESTVITDFTLVGILGSNDHCPGVLEGGPSLYTWVYLAPDTGSVEKPPVADQAARELPPWTWGRLVAMPSRTHTCLLQPDSGGTRGADKPASGL